MSSESASNARTEVCVAERSAGKHVVVVGGGFAGLHCALILAGRPGVRVTLLDKNNYQQFQPLLYQVATATLPASDAAFNLRQILVRHGNVDVKMTEVVSVDLQTKTVRGKSGDSYTGDFLVLAAGAQANFFGTPGIEEFAFPLYSLRDAERLRSRILEILENADVQCAADASRAPHFVVVGGGATGVEIAGALADLVGLTPKQAFKHLKIRDVSVTLINGKREVLTGFTDKSRGYGQAILEKRGVKLLLGEHVKELTETEIVLSDDRRLPCNLAIWAGGLKAANLAGALGIKQGAGGRLDVKADLSLEGFPEVYALGDFANIPDEKGEILPQLASVAQQAGRHCARNILRRIDGQEHARFDYLDKGIMAMVGRNAAVAEVGKGHRSLTGWLAFLAWLAVHNVLLTTFRARVGACVEWILTYVGSVRVEAILDAPSGEVGRKRGV